MIGSRQMERVTAEAEKRGAKVVLIGDPEQLQAIEAGAAFRSIAERHGSVEITEVRRQREDWQRDATRHLATERTGEAIRAYEEHGHVHAAAIRDDARAALIDRWDRNRRTSPDVSRLILTHTNDEVETLNVAAREKLRAAGQLGEEVAIRTERGERQFARGDRIMFLRNERSLGVKNGSLGTVESVTSVRMAFMLDDGRAVAFDLKDYANVDHGYAATIHKAQGVTVDRVHVLATPGLDRHAAYVALSRHRDRVDLHFGQDEFANQDKLIRTLARERGKDMATDYAIASPIAHSARDPFAGLKLDPSTVIIPAPDPLDQAVVRVARATADIMRMRRQGLEELPHQQKALEESAKALKAIQPDAARDLRVAFVKDMGLFDEAAQGRPSAAIRAKTLERELRIDLTQRADRFVATWQAQSKHLDALSRDGEYRAADRLRDGMNGLAKSLHRDPQLESLLRNRLKELGVGKSSGASLAHDLLNHPALSRSRGLGC